MLQLHEQMSLQTKEKLVPEAADCEENGETCNVVEDYENELGTGRRVLSVVSGRICNKQLG